PLHDREDCACRGGRRRCSTEELRDGHAANPGRPAGIIVSPSHHVFVLRQICARKKSALITTTSDDAMHRTVRHITLVSRAGAGRHAVPPLPALVGRAGRPNIAVNVSPISNILAIWTIILRRPPAGRRGRAWTKSQPAIPVRSPPCRARASARHPRHRATWIPAWALPLHGARFSGRRTMLASAVSPTALPQATWRCSVAFP